MSDTPDNGETQPNLQLRILGITEKEYTKKEVTYIKDGIKLSRLTKIREKVYEKYLIIF